MNSGPTRAVKSLQKVVGVRDDGHMGEQTLAAVRKYPGGVSQLIRDYCDERMRFLKALTGKTGFASNGRGWTIRVTGEDPKGQWQKQPGVLGNALKLAANASGSTVEKSLAPDEAGAKADARDTGLTEIVKKPEAWGSIGSIITAFGAVFAGNGPAQWALAVIMCAFALAGLWYFIRRVREAG